MSAQTELPLPGEAWPRLSRSLPHPRRLDTCQACGAKAAPLDDPQEMLRLGSGGVERTPEGEPLPTLPRWIEHDDQDRPQPIVVVLCIPCSRRIIEPHPRLYDLLPTLKPVPGAMGICAGCVHNRGLVCRSPEARFNGGEGLQIEAPEPGVVHLCMRGRGGGRTGGWRRWYTKPATGCSGREVAG